MLRNGRDFLITFTQIRATATCSISIVLEEHIAFDKIVSMHVWESECVLQMLKSILKITLWLVVSTINKGQYTTVGNA